MNGRFLLLVVHKSVNGDCLVTTDIEQAVTVAYKHRGECSVVVACADTWLAEKRTIHKDADTDEIRNRIKSGMQLSKLGIGRDPLH